MTLQRHPLQTIHNTIHNITACRDQLVQDLHPVNSVFFIHVHQLLFDVPPGAVHLAAKGGQHEVRTMHVLSKGQAKITTFQT